jgi:hypothetical protein
MKIKVYLTQRDKKKESSFRQISTQSIFICARKTALMCLSNSAVYLRTRAGIVLNPGRAGEVKNSF